MPIKIRCGCGNILVAPDERIGQTGHCPACNRAITVELPSGEPESMADTAESAKSPEPAAVPLTAKPLRRSLLTRLGSLCIYLLFLALAAGITALQMFTPQEISKLEIPQFAWLQEEWQASSELLLIAREDQRTVAQKVWLDSVELYLLAKSKWKEWRASNKKKASLQESTEEE